MFSQRLTQGPQLCQRGAHGSTQCQRFSLGQHLLPGAGERFQTAQSVNALGRESCFPGGFLQIVGALVADAGQKPGTDGLGGPHGVQQSRHKAHVAQLQHKLPVCQRQTLQGQGDGLHRDRVIHGADALQTHLPDLPEGMAFLTGTVDIFRIVKPPAAAGFHLGVFGNGKGHIRFEGQQAAIQVRERDDLLAWQKPAEIPVPGA